VRGVAMRIEDPITTDRKSGAYIKSADGTEAR
jgi:hypothetical protein